MTGEKDVQYEVCCLESGADDYLRKPFLPAQLLARLHAVSRRGRSTLRFSPPPVITTGRVHLDTRINEVTIAGKTVRLSLSKANYCTYW
jgi:DNA-binding response OmpR family regulator